MILAFVLAGAVGASCGPLVANDAGGDYTNAADSGKLAVVESFHFTAEVEALRRGVSDQLGGDIGYTLEHFPNHHRALAAMARLSQREKQPKPVGARYSVDCYFERAMRFAPADGAVRTIYGSYLLTMGRAEPALEQMREALRLDPANATTHYNLGLLLLKKKDFEQARKHAHEAYRRGFPLQGLKNKLVQAGQWREAEPAAQI
ncbi:MAG: tetratricopeptide repeat protein [Pseudomonadota bacterium]